MVTLEILPFHLLLAPFSEVLIYALRMPTSPQSLYLYTREGELEGTWLFLCSQEQKRQRAESSHLPRGARRCGRSSRPEIAPPALPRARQRRDASGSAGTRSAAPCEPAENRLSNSSGKTPNGMLKRSRG